jgi:hypothetical protein
MRTQVPENLRVSIVILIIQWRKIKNTQTVMSCFLEIPIWIVHNFNGPGLRSQLALIWSKSCTSILIRKENQACLYPLKGKVSSQWKVIKLVKWNLAAYDVLLVVLNKLGTKRYHSLAIQHNKVALNQQLRTINTYSPSLLGQQQEWNITYPPALWVEWQQDNKCHAPKIGRGYDRII